MSIPAAALRDVSIAISVSLVGVPPRWGRRGPGSTTTEASAAIVVRPIATTTASTPIVPATTSEAAFSAFAFSNFGKFPIAALLVFSFDSQFLSSLVGVDLVHDVSFDYSDVYKVGF